MRIFGFVLGAIGTIFVFFVNWILGFATIVVAIILLLIAQKPEGLKKCPKCAEEVKAEAVVCRFCGADVSQFVQEGKQYPGHMEGCRCKKCQEWGKYNKLCPVCGYKNQEQSVFCANSNCKYRFPDAEVK
jgi:ribosomal protein L32